jgi:hypothetical protein
MSVDYEPITRHGAPTMISIHVKKPQNTAHPIELRVNQQMIEPMGYQRSVPLANTSSVSNDGMSLTFNAVPDQSDVLVRFELMPNAVGFIPMHVSDGTDSIDWSLLVVP